MPSQRPPLQPENLVQRQVGRGHVARHLRDAWELVRIRLAEKPCDKASRDEDEEEGQQEQHDEPGNRAA